MDQEDLGGARAGKELDALRKRRVERGRLRRPGNNEGAVRGVPSRKQFEIVLENRVGLLSPEARGAGSSV
jgi:hypothetical protein